MTDLSELYLTSLTDIFKLPDAGAAMVLDARMAAWAKLDGLQERSFVERGLIIREFEIRKLWAHLEDPDTGQAFPNLTAWLSCNEFLGCRRTNFEAKRTLSMLTDVPSHKLIDIPKGNLHLLTQLSTAVRNDPGVLEAARTMMREAFEERIEKDHPTQHLPARKAMRFRLTRDETRIVEEAIEWAMEYEVAATRDEALARMAEVALEAWRK